MMKIVRNTLSSTFIRKPVRGVWVRAWLCARVSLVCICVHALHTEPLLERVARLQPDRQLHCVSQRKQVRVRVNVCECEAQAL